MMTTLDDPALPEGMPGPGCGSFFEQGHGIRTYRRHGCRKHGALKETVCLNKRRLPWKHSITFLSSAVPPKIVSRCCAPESPWPETSGRNCMSCTSSTIPFNVNGWNLPVPSLDEEYKAMVVQAREELDRIIRRRKGRRHGDQRVGQGWRSGGSHFPGGREGRRRSLS